MQGGFTSRYVERGDETGSEKVGRVTNIGQGRENQRVMANDD